MPQHERVLTIDEIQVLINGAGRDTPIYLARTVERAVLEKLFKQIKTATKIQERLLLAMQCAMIEFNNSGDGENAPLQSWIETALDTYGDSLEVHHDDVTESADQYYLTRMAEIDND